MGEGGEMKRKLINIFNNAVFATIFALGLHGQMTWAHGLSWLIIILILAYSVSLFAFGVLANNYEANPETLAKMKKCGQPLGDKATLIIDVILAVILATGGSVLGALIVLASHFLSLAGWQYINESE